MGGKVAVENQRPFPKLGITMSGIQEFVQKVGVAKLKDLTTTQVSPIVQELTKNAQCSYCDAFEESNNIRLANVFISHAWKYQFLNVVSALQNHYKQKSAEEQQNVVFWFDLFSNNQHGLDSGAPPPFSWWCNTFMTAIKQIGTVVMVLEPWSNPVTLTRVWCLWEVYCASATRSKFEIAMSETETIVYREQIVNDTNGFVRMLSNIDVRNSDAFNPRDKEQIFQVINKTVGFQKLNSLVLTTVRKWALFDLNAYSKSILAPDNFHSDLSRIEKLADVYGALSSIGLAADLEGEKIVQYWIKEAYILHCNVLGEQHDKSLQSLRKLAKINKGYTESACEKLSVRFGSSSIYVWDVKLKKYKNYQLQDKFIDDWPKIIAEIDEENALLVADVVFRAVKGYAHQDEHHRRKLHSMLASLKSTVTKLRELLPANNVSLLKLEILLITENRKPVDDDFQTLKLCSMRLKETLGSNHVDVRNAYEEARNVAFDWNKTEHFLDFAWEHWACSVVMFEPLDLVLDAALIACVPCNSFRTHCCTSACCWDDDCCRTCIIAIPVYFICCVPSLILFLGTTCCCGYCFKVQSKAHMVDSIS